MDENLEKTTKNIKNSIKPDLVKIVENLLSKYAEELKYDHVLISKLVDFITNYIYYILSESNQLAEFKKQENIIGEHVNLAINTIMKKINCVEREEIPGIVKMMKVVKHHNLTSEERYLKSYN